MSFLKLSVVFFAGYLSFFGIYATQEGSIFDEVSSTAAYLKLGSKWQNELGSVMIITYVNRTTGSFTGTYNSAVGEAFKEYELQGRFDIEGSSLGWVVSFRNKYLNAHSTTAWSGQVQIIQGEKPIIQTTWLLTTQSSPADAWKSTNIGFDTFMPVQVQPAQ